jgi:hypothetical protein
MGDAMRIQSRSHLASWGVWRGHVDGRSILELNAQIGTASRLGIEKILLILFFSRTPNAVAVDSTLFWTIQFLP